MQYSTVSLHHDGKGNLLRQTSSLVSQYIQVDDWVTEWIIKKIQTFLTLKTGKTVLQTMSFDSYKPFVS